MYVSRCQSLSDEDISGQYFYSQRRLQSSSPYEDRPREHANGLQSLLFRFVKVHHVILIDHAFAQESEVKVPVHI